MIIMMVALGQLWSGKGSGPDRPLVLAILKILYLYCDERRDVRWNPLGFALGISLGLRLYFIVFFDWNHNTDILNYKSSIDLPGRSRLILCIALTAGQYVKIFPRRGFPRASRVAPRDFPRAKPEGNPEEQPCHPEENPVHPDSFYLDLHSI